MPINSLHNYPRKVMGDNQNFRPERMLDAGHARY